MQDHAKRFYHVTDDVIYGLIAWFMYLGIGYVQKRK